MALPAASLRLDDDSVCFLPSRLRRLRGAQAVTVPYALIEGLSMTEPQGLAPGRLTVRVADDEDCTVLFGPFKLRDMRHVYAEMWRRSRLAHASRPELGH